MNKKSAEGAEAQSAQRNGGQVPTSGGREQQIPRCVTGMPDQFGTPADRHFRLWIVELGMPGRFESGPLEDKGVQTVAIGNDFRIRGAM